MREDKSIKTNISTHWAVFFVATVLLLFFRYILLNDAAEGTRFTIFTIYMAGIWLYLSIVSFIESSRLSSHMEDNHNFIYTEVYGYKGYTPFYNGFKIRKFIKSDENYGDQVVNILKNRCRSHIKLMITAFIVLPFTFVAFML